MERDTRVEKTNKQKYMQFILNNKAVIAAYVLAISGYLLAKGFIGQLEAGLIGTLVTITFGVKPAMMLGARLIRK